MKLFASHFQTSVYLEHLLSLLNRCPQKISSDLCII